MSENETKDTSDIFNLKTKIKKVYNNLFNTNKNKKYGETDLLKGGNQYYPPKP